MLMKGNLVINYVIVISNKNTVAVSFLQYKKLVLLKDN